MSGQRELIPSLSPSAIKFLCTSVVTTTFSNKELNCGLKAWIINRLDKALGTGEK